MYHPVTVQHSIDTLLRLKRIKSAPEYHTRMECQQAAEVISHTRKMDDAGNVIDQAPFTPDMVAWIKNERLLCKLDFHYFISRYGRITDSSDQPSHFDPWVSQKIFLDIVAEMELDELAIMLIVLKARQLGISRIVSLLILHRLMFYSNINALMGSSTPAKTLKLLDMWEYPFKQLPFWLPPKVTARRRDGEGGFVEFGKINCGITLQHGAQMTGICRGTTPTLGHLTELAEYDNFHSIIDASLLRAMHDHPRTMLILEGTAEGQHNPWHKKWISSKEGWPERRSRLRPVFLPWFVGTDLYPTPTWLRAHPIPDQYQPKPYILDHARRAAEYVSSNELMRKYLGDGWKMPISQQWFYEVEYDQAVNEDRVNKFLQEMPASDDEAFQSSATSVFSNQVVVSTRSGNKKPLGVYGLLGPQDIISARLQPHHTLIDPSQPPIPVRWDWGMTQYDLTLVPLKWFGYSTDSGLDKIYIWERPQPGETYGIGVDASKGVEKDRSAMEVIRKGTMWAKAAQVAEFACSKVNALELLPFTMALASYYSVEPLEDKLTDGPILRRQIRLAIECLTEGDQLQARLRMMGWTNFHKWQRNDGKPQNPETVGKVGIYTNPWFRATLMEWLVKMIRDGEIDIRSPFFVDEMQSLEVDDEFRASIKAAKGAFDDRILALGFPIVSLYQFERDRPIANPTAPKPDVNGPRKYAVYVPNAQETMNAIK